MNDTATARPAAAARGGLSTRPLVQLVLARIHEFTREPEAVFWALFFPILLSAGLGVAFRGGSIDVVQIAASSPGLAAALRPDPAIRVLEVDAAGARQALATGKVALVVEPSVDGGVLYSYDETNPEGRMARLVVDRAVQRAAGRVDPEPSKDLLVREPGSRYIDFVIPGLVGLGIMSNALWGIGFGIVDSRRRKLMKLLTATPMSRASYLLSFLVLRLLVLVVEVVIPIGFGALAFGVPVRGRLIDLAVIAVVASLSFAAMGLFVASRARTVEAVSGIVNLIQVPMWILSGVFFSSERFPDAARPFIRALPLTAAIDAFRGHMLQGASLMDVLPELGTLAVWLVISFSLALKFFRWR